MNHLSSIQPGDTIYVKGFEDQEFEFVGHSAEQPLVTVRLPGNRRVKTRAFPSLLGRLKAAPESVAGAEMWTVPAIHVAKRPFSRLVGFSVFAAMIFSGAAFAETRSPGFLGFCEAASSANIQGISAAPDSELGRRIVINGGVKKEDYEAVWRIAKTSIFPICRGLW
jgi:hypothetical protein